jgi:hypothetical protein
MSQVGIKFIQNIQPFYLIKRLIYYSYVMRELHMPSLEYIFRQQTLGKQKVFKKPPWHGGFDDNIMG